MAEQNIQQLQKIKELTAAAELKYDAIILKMDSIKVVADSVHQSSNGNGEMIIYAVCSLTLALVVLGIGLYLNSSDSTDAVLRSFDVLGKAISYSGESTVKAQGIHTDKIIGILESSQNQTSTLVLNKLDTIITAVAEAAPPAIGQVTAQVGEAAAPVAPNMLFT